MSVMLL
jgi:hypothetical protein